MNMEIKFRAWDKKDKRYIHSLWINGNGTIRVSPNGDPEKYHCLEDKRYTDRYEIEQYTGVKDRYKKDVYDNDIVLNMNGSTREVGFNYHRSQFGLYSRGLECWVTNELLTHGVEIIGNIHENKEFLK